MTIKYDNPYGCNYKNKHYPMRVFERMLDNVIIYNYVCRNCYKDLNKIEIFDRNFYKDSE